MLLETERILGRVRDGQKNGYQDRAIDLDLLYYGSLIYDDPRLTLPHPHLKERLFVLEPMIDVASGFVDPVVSKSMLELHQILRRKIDNREIDNQEIKRGTWPASE
jgi:7,8-dihydro-6-hydroxymethylpterin-pyrophosphokinase